MGWGRGHIQSIDVPFYAVPGAFHAPGEVFYVGNSTSIHGKAIEASDGNKGTEKQPFATLEYALTRCSADRGDVIYINEGHVEELDEALDIDVAGVRIIGLGNGDLKPKFSCVDDTAAGLVITADNVMLWNINVVCDIDEQAVMLSIQAQYVDVGYCGLLEGTETGFVGVEVGTDDAEANWSQVHHCEFDMPTEDNWESAIKLDYDQYGCKIETNDIYGCFSVAGINYGANCDAGLRNHIRFNHIKNGTTGEFCIQVDGASSGFCTHNRCACDDVETCLDSGGLYCEDNLWSGLVDSDTEGVPCNPLKDTGTNPIGYNDNANTFSSGNVAGDRDGSVLERLEDILARIAGENVSSNPLLGIKVTRAKADVLDGTTAPGNPIFTVAGGRVLITQLSMEVCDAALGAAANVKFHTNPTVGTDADMCAVLAVAADEEGSVYSITGEPATALTGGSGGGCNAMISPWIVAEGTINIDSSADTNAGNSATESFELWYIPLDTGAVVTAVA